MARPSKSVNVMSKNLTKEEREIRQETEQKLKGNSDKIKPPSHLNSEQKKIFRYIVNELEASKILGNLDIYILANTSIAIYWIQVIDKQLNEDFSKLSDKTLMATREKFIKDFFRGCTELSLSPASRAKLGNINLQSQQKQADPLLQVLNGGGSAND